MGSKHAACVRLFSYKYKGQGVQKHCDEVIQLMNELSDTGVTIESDLQVCILLYSLPAELSTFVSTVCGQDSTNLTLDAVRIRAISEEARLRETECELALYSKYKHPVKHVSPLKRKVKGKVKCFRCKSDDHIVRDCPEPKREVAAVVHEGKKAKIEETAKVEEDLMDWEDSAVDLKEMPIKSYRTSQLNDEEIAKAKAEEIKKAKEKEAREILETLASVLDGKTWVQARAALPHQFIRWTRNDKVTYVKKTYPKFEGYLGPGLRNIFLKKLFGLTATQRAALEVKLKSSEDKMLKEKEEKKEKESVEVKDTEKVLVGSKDGLENKTLQLMCLLLTPEQRPILLGVPRSLVTFPLKKV